MPSRSLSGPWVAAYLAPLLGVVLLAASLDQGDALEADVPAPSPPSAQSTQGEDPEVSAETAGWDRGYGAEDKRGWGAIQDGERFAHQPEVSPKD
jgi:hypothetical protein